MNFPNPKCCHNQIKDCCHSIPPRLPILLLLLLIDTLIVMLLFLMIYGVYDDLGESFISKNSIYHLFLKIDSTKYFFINWKSAILAQERDKKYSRLDFRYYIQGKCILATTENRILQILIHIGNKF